MSQVRSRSRSAARLAADVEAGLRRGLRGTPTLFFDGDRFEGEPTFGALYGAALRARAGAAD